MAEWVAPTIIGSLVSAAFASLGTALVFLLKYSNRLAEMSQKIDGMIRVCTERHSGLDRSCAMESQTIDALAERITHLERTRGQTFKEVDHAG